MVLCKLQTKGIVSIPSISFVQMEKKEMEIEEICFLQTFLILWREL